MELPRLGAMFHRQPVFLRTCILIFLSETSSVTVHYQYSWLKPFMAVFPEEVYNLIIHISLANVPQLSQFAPNVL